MSELKKLRISFFNNVSIRDCKNTILIAWRGCFVSTNVHIILTIDSSKVLKFVNKIAHDAPVLKRMIKKRLLNSILSRKEKFYSKE